MCTNLKNCHCTCTRPKLQSEGMDELPTYSRYKYQQLSYQDVGKATRNRMAEKLCMVMKLLDETTANVFLCHLQDRMKGCIHIQYLRLSFGYKFCHFHTVIALYMPLYSSNAPYPNYATITFVYPGILSVQTHFCMGLEVCAAHRNSN